MAGESRIIELKDRPPVLAVPVQLRDCIVWQDPTSQERREWIVPRNSVLLLPVQTY